MTARTITAIALVLVAAVAAGCGSNSSKGRQLSVGEAQQLLGQLNSIQGRFDDGSAGACDDITDGDDPNTTQVDNILGSLPKGVDADLRDALQGSFDHLFDLVKQECGQRTRTETNTTPQPTETTRTTTTPTTTTPTTTTPTTTTPTTTTPTGTDTGPSGGTPGNGNGNGNGKGNGNGNGGAGQ